MKIAVATSHSPDFEALARHTLPGKERYCAARGYNLVVHVAEDAKDPWTKVKMIRELIGSHDEVLWLDCDALVMNMAKPVEEVPAGDIVFACDMYGINDGVSLTRRSVWSEMFWWAVDNGRRLAEPSLWGSQEAVIRFAQAAPYRNHITIVPQNTMNSYLMENYDDQRSGTWPGTYGSGDWILHLPGFEMEQKLKFAAEYAARAR